MPGTIRWEGKTFRLLPFCVELHQIKGNLADGFLGALLGFVPGGATHSIELRGRFACRAIPTKTPQLIGCNPKSSIGVLHHEVVAHVAGHRQFFHGFEPTNAMVAMHHEITRPHFVGVNGAAGCLATPPDIPTGTQTLLPKEFTVGDQSDPPGGQLEAFQFCGAPDFQSNRGVLLNQSGNRVAVSRVRNKTTDAVVLFKQGNSSAGLCRNQPNRGAIVLEPLDQFPELSELIGIGRNRSTGQVEAVRVLVDFQQFCHIEAMEDLRQPIGGIDVSVEDGRPELIARTVIETSLFRHLAVVFIHVAQPLLAMGQAVASFVHDHRCAVGEIIKQGCGLLPGEAHEATHSLWCSTVQQLLSTLIPKELFEPIRHRSAQLIGDQWSKSRWCES